MTSVLGVGGISPRGTDHGIGARVESMLKHDQGFVK